MFFFKADLDLKNDRQALFTQFVKNYFSSHTCTCIHHKFRAMAIDKIFLKYRIGRSEINIQCRNIKNKKLTYVLCYRMR